MHEKPKKHLIIETISVIIAIVIMVVAFILTRNGYLESDPLIITLYATAFIIGGYSKAIEGVLETIEHKALNVEILMIIAAISAFIVGNPSEGSLLIMIFAISGILEGYTGSKSKKELTDLLNLTPDTATLLKDGKEEIVSIDSLKLNDVVFVKVGELIPVDGIIVEGISTIDEATITGESMPVTKGVKANVFAGTINLSSPLLVKTTLDPSEFVVNKIITLVNEAQQNKGRRQTKVEKFEKWYVYFVILLAALFMLIPPLFNLLTWEDAFYRGTVVLVVGSPCALMASIAPALLSSLSNASRKRILVKGAYLFEDLTSIKSVIFDKTGTITKGTPEVTKITIDKGFNKEEILNVIYSMEKQSTHPLAYAITKHLNEKAKDVKIEVEEVHGQGMVCKCEGDNYKLGKFAYKENKPIEKLLNIELENGSSIVNIIKNDQLIGFISLKDEVREGVKETIKSLNQMKIKTIMLTGDNDHNASLIAKEIGIKEFKANLLPHEKKEYVLKLKEELGKVLMVGDGINDALAISSADIGVSMGSGTDLSIETSDIIFMNNKLENLATLFNLAKENNKIILQNIIFSISVISLLLLINVFGIIKLPVGVLFHEGSTILVILNSLRMLTKK
ncbi:MAG: heavy metal translocating P-type ATPase [Acholeplasmataceae bacterium]